MMTRAKKKTPRPIKAQKSAIRKLLPLIFLLCLAASGVAVFQTSRPAPIYRYRIVNTYPHDPAAFTQGLVFEDGFLWEGTGLEGQSSVRKVDLKTGTPVMSVSVPAPYFGEGITLWKGCLIQLTWKSGIAFVYDAAALKRVSQFKFSGEGWGITHDDKNLIVSDGTSQLRFLDPETFRESRRLEIRDKDMPIDYLNELEYVKGEIYANVWKTDRIARISPKTGQVTGWIDLSGLLADERNEGRKVDVLNGIAYDSQNDRLFVTGKLWPKLFEVQLTR